MKLGCLAQAMMVPPSGDKATANGGGMGDNVEGDVDMEVEVKNTKHSTLSTT